MLANLQPLRRCSGVMVLALAGIAQLPRLRQRFSFLLQTRVRKIHEEKERERERKENEERKREEEKKKKGKERREREERSFLSSLSLSSLSRRDHTGEREKQRRKETRGVYMPSQRRNRTDSQYT